MQSIGERLEEARKKKGISIREAAEATKIRGDYLQQFENNRFDINLTEIYVRGFLRGYATYLKVPADKLLNDYASLGRAEPRSRQPSREVYGRMDVSIASAADRGESDADEAPAPAPAPARRQAAVSRERHAPVGPAIDPALLFKLGKWAAILVIILLFLWGVKAILSSGGNNNTATTTRPPAASSPVTAPAPSVVASNADRTITLVALDTVRVTIRNKNADDTEGSILFQGTLNRGQAQVVPWPGPIYITANAGESLKIEYKGNRYDSRIIGSGRSQM